MHVIYAKSVNEALSSFLWKLQTSHTLEDTRNGPAMMLNAPLAMVYTNPSRRVLMSPMRDANPFFHLMEAMWMLAGRNDVGFLKLFVKRFTQYSDDGSTIPGAYGHRWRVRFGVDQLKVAANLLRTDPTSRRAVLTMWHPDDLKIAGESRDVPCNTQCYFSVSDGRLDMLVTSRSGDALWGLFGANVVHFSFLLEYMAACVGVAVGTYTHVCNNAHLYATSGWHADNLHTLALDVAAAEHDRVGQPLFPAEGCDPTAGFGFFTQDLHWFFRAHDDATTPARYMYTTPFVRDVVVPAYIAHTMYRGKLFAAAREVVAAITADDWRAAMLQWLDRRTQG